MMVRVPVPRSCVPSSTTTEPSGLMVVRHLLAWPPPPQVLHADAEAALHRTRACCAARMPVLLPFGQFGAFSQLRTIDCPRARV